VGTVSLKNFNLSIFYTKKKIGAYIYNNNYFCFLKFSKNIKPILKVGDILEVLNSTSDNKQIIRYLQQFHFSEFTKIKFKGKGYKIKKNTNKSIILIFNRAHTTVLW
jgi:hypothetical protein